MYGTVAKIKIKPGAIDELTRWNNDGEHSPGYVGAYAFQTDADPDELYMVAIFDSKESYFANAGSPEQAAAYERMAKFFAAEPEWHDGQVVYARLAE
jgi:quinol monooxygenase YgiN